MKNNNYLIYPTGSIRPIKNPLVYARKLQNTYYRSCSPYVKRILIQALPDGTAQVIYDLSDDRVLFSLWCSNTIAITYFTQRTRTLAGVPIQFK